MSCARGMLGCSSEAIFLSVG